MATWRRESWLSPAVRVGPSAISGRRLIAARDIPAGGEILADYALWEADEAYVSAWECRRGGPGCRGRATGRDWRRPDLQARCRDHFSPLLKRRIAAL